jgi:hypothetical protein
MALATEQDIVTLADQLTASADALHARLRAALRAGGVDQASAQGLFQDEVILRQRANALYTEAARCTVQGLALTQKELLEVLEAANKRIRRSRTLAGSLDLFGDLLVLAAAVCTAEIGPIAAALHKVQQDLAT